MSEPKTPDTAGARRPRGAAGPEGPSADPERVLGSELRRLGGNTLVYGFGQLINAGISFVLLPVFTRYLSPAEYGINSVLMLLVLVTAPIFTLGFGSSMGVSYFERDDAEHRQATLWTAVTLLFASALALVLSGLAGRVWISGMLLETPAHSYLVAVTLAGTGCQILATPLMLFLQFEERARTFVLLATLTTLTSIGLSVVLVVGYGRGVAGLVEARCLGQLVTVAAFLVPAIRGMRFRFSRPVARELLALGLPMVPSFAMIFVLMESNVYFLARLGGLDQTGIYSVGFSIGLTVSIVTSGLTRAWYPYFQSFRHRQEEAPYVFGRIRSYYVLLFGALGSCYFLGARSVVLIATQPAFHDAYRVVGFAALAHVFVGLYSLLKPGQFFAKDLKYNVWIQLPAAGAAVGLNLLLIPIAGALGAAVALAGGAGLLALCQQLWNRRRRYPETAYRPGRTVTASGLTLVLLIAGSWRRAWPLSLEAGGAVIACVLTVAAFWFLLSIDERRGLWSTARAWSGRKESDDDH